MADSETERRTILEQVADGSLSPAEAAERLAALDEEAGPAHEAASPLRRVRIASTGHPVRVLADTGVSEPVIEGPHTTRRDGDTLVVQAEVHDGTGFFLAGSWQRRVDTTGRMWRWAPPLIVRMPPELGLQVEVTATSLVVRDVRGPIAVAVAAGSANVSGFAGPIDLDVSAGSLTAGGVLDRGESSVRCSAGSVKLHLARGSNVRVRGTANAGRLVLPPSPSPVGPGRGARGPFGQEQESVIGDGATQARLDIDVTTGSVVVRADS